MTRGAAVRRRALTERLSYGEALELAAVLYTGQRLAEMALHGYPQHALPRVDGEEARAATSAMIADLKTDGAQVTALTRRGREAWPAGVVLGW